MPKDSVLDSIRTGSIAALSSYIEDLPGAMELQSSQVRAYSDRDFIVGWCVPVAFQDCVRNFHVLIPPGFPFSAPRIALVDRPAFLSWPHVEKDGVLCILQNSSTVSAHDPVGVLKNLFSRAISLVEGCRTEANASDFETEFNTYWRYEVADGSNRCRSLISLDARNRVIKWWRGKQFDIIVDQDAPIRNWLARRYPKTGSDSHAGVIELAGLFWLSRPLRPKEYPRTARDLQAIATAAGAMGTVAEVVAEEATDIRVILAAGTVNGPVLAGVSVPNPKAKDVMGRKTDPLRHGFRPGRVPPGLLANRFLSSGAPIVRFDVVRIDHDWIHGRGRDTRQAILKGRSVVVLGCGSVGSAVAVSLAKSGIGRLTLVDNETLDWPNTSRHSLGAASVGLKKATALAQELQTNYPHLEIIGRAMSVKEALQANPDFLGASDLIVSLTADWGMDQALGVWQRGKGGRPMLVYGWTEAHACAGHAVFTGETSCIECGRDATGVPHFALTEWPEDQEIQEPACGAAFQPYGAVEVASTVTLIGGLALDCLLEENVAPAHRFWAGPKSLLLASGGCWSSQWTTHPEFRDFGGLVVEQPWPPESRCAGCEGTGD